MHRLEELKQKRTYYVGELFNEIYFEIFECHSNCVTVQQKV